MTTSVQEGVQPGSVLTVAVPNPGGVPQGSTCMQRTYLFHPGGSSLCVCVCSALANSWCWIGQFFPSAVAFFFAIERSDGGSI